VNAQLLTLAGLFLANLLLLAGLATVLDRRARARFLAELAVQRKRSADAETEALEAEHALVAGRVKGTVRALEVAYARREQLLRAEIEADALRARVTTTTEGKTLVVLESAQMVMGELRRLLQLAGPAEDRPTGQLPPAPSAAEPSRGASLAVLPPAPSALAARSALPRSPTSQTTRRVEALEGPALALRRDEDDGEDEDDDEYTAVAARPRPSDLRGRPTAVGMTGGGSR